MRGRMLAGAFGCAGLLVLTLVAPAAGSRVGDGPRPGPACDHGCGMPATGGAGADCQDASMNAPPSGTGDVKLSADVADGDTLAPGQDVMLRLTWDPSRWSGSQIGRALQCVRVKGQLEPALSVEEQPAANDGVYEYRLHVPDNIKPGCDVCAQGFVAGTAANGGPLELRSERHCFMSGPPAPPPPGPPTPPMTRPPTPVATQPPATSPSAPPATSPPAPPATQPATTPTTAAAPRVPAELPAEVAGITATRPAPAPATPALPPAAAPTELPRTGSAAARTGTAGGGLALSLGGLAVIGGSGRRRRRRSNR